MRRESTQKFSEKYDQCYVALNETEVIGVGLDKECVEIEREQCEAVKVHCLSDPYHEARRLGAVQEVTEIGVIVETELLTVVVE